MYNLPNILTISRIAVIPLIFISIYIHSFMWAMFVGVLFIAASITDYLDGYLARARNETSAFGRLLDPIADKLLVATALVVILTKTYNPDDGAVTLHYYTWSGTIIAAFVILCREILVSGLREFLREVNVGLPVTKLAKWKTAFQMTALAMMLFCELSLFWGYLGEFLLWVAAVLTFITGYQYYQKSLEYVKAEAAEKVNAVKKTVVEVKPTKAKNSAVKSPSHKVAGKAKAAKRTSGTKKVVEKAEVVPESKVVKNASATDEKTPVVKAVKNVKKTVAGKVAKPKAAKTVKK